MFPHFQFSIAAKKGFRIRQVKRVKRAATQLRALKMAIKIKFPYTLRLA